MRCMRHEQRIGNLCGREHDQAPQRSGTRRGTPSGLAGLARIDPGMRRLKTMFAAAARLRARIEKQGHQASARERPGGRPFKPQPSPVHRSRKS